MFGISANRLFPVPSWLGVLINTLVPKFHFLSPCDLFSYLQVALDQLKPGGRFHIRVFGYARLVGE